MKEEDIGWVVRPEDPFDLAEAIRSAASDRDEMCKMSSCYSHCSTLYVRSRDCFLSASHERHHAQPPNGMIMVPIILVTGANGFVGRHVVSALTQAGWHVRSAQRSAGPTFSTADIVPGLELGPSTNWQAALEERRQLFTLLRVRTVPETFRNARRIYILPSMLKAPCNLHAALFQPGYRSLFFSAVLQSTVVQLMDEHLFLRMTSRHRIRSTEEQRPPRSSVFQSLPLTAQCQ